MILQKKTLEKLRNLINEDTEYRSGPNLIKFFSQLGFNDTYGQGFPSRWIYTDSRLEQINGTPEIDKCIKILFAPVNFVGHFDKLDHLINDFNQYLAFDKWQVTRQNTEITFSKLDKVDIGSNSKSNSESDFLKREFNDIDIKALGLESPVTSVLELRLKEMEKCFTANAPLSVIFLAGSTLEGILLGLAIKYPRHFNTAKSSPKDSNGKIKQFHEWSLSAFIDVSKEIGLIESDTHKFSHALRDFRNYIHPFEQMSSGFNPRENTAKICLQVLKSAIHDICCNKLKFDT